MNVAPVLAVGDSVMLGAAPAASPSTASSRC